MFNLSGLEVPDDDIGREVGETVLGAGEVFAVFGDFHTYHKKE